MFTKIMWFILVVTTLFFLSCNNQDTSRKDKKTNTGMSDTIVASIFESETEDLKSPNTNKGQVLCECFLLDSGRVAVYDTISGEVIDSIQNDYQMESFYTVKVFISNNNWFRVRLEAIETESEGWVLNNSLLGVYSKNYTDTLFVYSNPDTTSNKECIFPDYFTTAMKVHKCENEWMKIEVESNEKKCTGWVLQSMTCPSPYTTCN